VPRSCLVVMQGRYSRVSISGQEVLERLNEAIETVSGHQLVALAAASEDGFRHLEEERRLKQLSHSLEVAAGELQSAEKRVSMVVAVRDTMQQRLLSAQQQQQGEAAAVERSSEDWHDFSEATSK